MPGWTTTRQSSEVTFEADGTSVPNLWRMEKHDPFFADFARSLRAAYTRARPQA